MKDVPLVADASLLVEFAMATGSGVVEEIFMAIAKMQLQRITVLPRGH